MLILIACVGALLAAFRCEVLMLTDHVLGTQFVNKLATIQTNDELKAALVNKHCIFLITHAWSIEDAIIKRRLEEELACNDNLGRFKIYLVDPIDSLNSEEIYSELDNLCGTNGKLPRFQHFVKSAGMFVLKSGDETKWQKRVDSFENLKKIALANSVDGG